MLRGLLRHGAPTPGLRRSISNNPRIIERNVRRKIKQGLDRLPSQGPDPAASFKHGWRIACAAVVERYPVVTPECDPFEIEYRTGLFLERQRCARSSSPDLYLSERDRIEGRTEPRLDDPRAEFYEPAPRRTEADAKNDTRSQERALDERLYFVVKRTEKSGHMQFPQILATDENVPLSSYAEQAYKGVTLPGSRPAVHFLSRSPTCHLEHVYPVAYQQRHNVYGLKIFFYRGMLLNGEVEGIRNGVDYAWARDCELADLLGEKYYAAIKPLLFGVGPTIRPPSDSGG